MDDIRCLEAMATWVIEVFDFKYKVGIRGCLETMSA